MIPNNSTVACHDCDAIFHAGSLAVGQAANCRQCGAHLYAARPRGIANALALTCASTVCLVAANVFPLLGFSLQGRVQTCTLLTGVTELGRTGMWALAVLVFIASIAAPALRVAGMLYVLGSLVLRSRAPGAAAVFRHLQALRPWVMIEVYMLGLLVAMVKLSQLATIIIGPALYAFVALMLCLAAADSALEPRDVWQRLRTRRPA